MQRYSTAVEWQRLAIALLPPDDRIEYLERLHLYEAGMPYLEEQKGRPAGTNTIPHPAPRLPT